MTLEIATQALVDEFSSRPTVRAGSLIITVFGDAIAPRGGTVWIGSLIRVLRDFGISERLVRTSVFRLTRDDWLEAEQVGRRMARSLDDEFARDFAARRQVEEHQQGMLHERQPGRRLEVALLLLIQGVRCVIRCDDVDAPSTYMKLTQNSWPGGGADS